MPGRIFRAIGDEFNHRFSAKNNTSAKEFVGFQSNGAVVVRDSRHGYRPNVMAVEKIPTVTNPDLILGVVGEGIEEKKVRYV
jgi:hypothetical protein